MDIITNCEVDENRQPILDRIRKHITYYMGNAVQHNFLIEAVETLYNRDYKDKKQIFVPECFLTKCPKMIFHEKAKLEELLNDMNISDKEKGKLRWVSSSTF